MSQLLKKKKSGLPSEEVFLALKEPTVNGCGCGLDCDLGALVLPNYNATSGDVIGYRALYLVDGVITNQTYAVANAAICAMKSNVLVKATSAAISGCLVANLAVAATRQLTASVLPLGSLQTGTWLSLTPATATVSGTGLVTGVAPGAVVIRFTSTDGSFIANCTVNVL